MTRSSSAPRRHEVHAPGLGGSRQGILSALKRSDGATVPILARIVGLNIETVREHLRALE